jgi:hypothetical protein
VFRACCVQRVPAVIVRTASRVVEPLAAFITHAHAGSARRVTLVIGNNGAVTSTVLLSVLLAGSVCAHVSASLSPAVLATLVQQVQCWCVRVLV